ncbi:MAG: hypothetical protein ACRYFS_21210 [Janthinobacterium lividum]
MNVEPSGVVMIGECDVRIPSVCTALSPAPITAVWGFPSRRQYDVCRPCLEEMVRLGEWEIQGARISRKYDIAIYDATERLQLVVEVKDYPYKPPTHLEAWATRIRRNLLLHSGIPRSIYFLLAVYPAPFFLWTKEDAPEALPRYNFDVRSEMPDLYGSSQRVDYKQQEDAVYSWLIPLINIQNESEKKLDAYAWLYESGLHKAIQGGKIVRQADQIETRERQAA